MRAERADDRTIAALTELRLAYIREMDGGGLTAEAEKGLRDVLPAYFTAHLNRDLFVYLAEKDGAVVSCAFLVIKELPPNLSFPTGKVGTVYNVYTLPAYRRKGYARRVMRELMNGAERMGADLLELKATRDGIRLYETLGFRETDPEYVPMRKDFRKITNASEIGSRERSE